MTSPSAVSVHITNLAKVAPWMSRLLAALMILSCAACSRATYQVAALTDAGVADSGAAGEPAFPITGINSPTLTLTAVEPGSGPFSGGTTVVVRGSGFDDSAVIRVGGVEVRPDDIKLDGRNRITIVVPAGQVGPADITLTQGGKSVTLPGGFVYNGLRVTPPQGSSAGGSLVEIAISGGMLTDASTIEFDGAPCTELRVLGPQLGSCKTPAHDPGLVDVIVRPDDSSLPLIAPKGYAYIDSLDAVGGGLSGGSITGTINITVVDPDTGALIPEALVLLGDDPAGKFRGLTDNRGAITFSDVDLRGPVTVHVSAKCFQRTSIVSFDAQDVTVYLYAVPDLSCAGDGEPGPARRQLAATISGQLLFSGNKEFAINSWDIVPKPKDNEVRVAYVFTTKSGVDSQNPDPSGAGAEMARIVEDTARLGDRGYVYRIVARPAGLAVYALCGLERLDTNEFTPYVMGIAHNVVTWPGEETRNVDLAMNITLDHELAVSLAGYPPSTAAGPDEFRVRAYIDLGGEGVIVREVGRLEYDVLTRKTGSELFRFLGQPAFRGALAGATYYVQAGTYTGKTDVPFTSQKRTGVAQTTTPLAFRDFLGIPQLAAPANGSTIPEDRKLRFTIDGPSPDLITVDILGGNGLPAWTLVLPGSAREVPIPDLSKIEGQADLAAGFIRWMVTAVKIDDLNYNEFQFSLLQSRYWTHTSRNVFFARR